MNQIIIEKMKENIKKDPVLKTYLDAGINKYGLTEEEALDCMIEAWWQGVNK